MLNRVSVSALLKCVIAVLSAAVVIMLAISAWSSWGRLDAASRIAAIADASGYMFTALHNLRVDRTSSFRDLQADRVFTSMGQLLRESREGEMPALNGALVALANVDFPERATAIADLEQKIKKLVALHQESAAALAQPKAARRAGLAQETYDAADCAHHHARQAVDAADPAGEARRRLRRSVAGAQATRLVGTQLGRRRPSGDFQHDGRATDSAGCAAQVHVLDEQVRGVLGRARRDGCRPAVAGQVHRGGRQGQAGILRARLPGATREGPQGPDRGRTDRLYDGSVVAGVGGEECASSSASAEAALDVAKDHAAQQRSAAMRDLVIQLALLVAALR